MDQDADAFLRDPKHTLMVVSTASDNVPEAAVVAYSVLSKGRILFGTSEDSRKFVNLQQNPKVALVIGWAEGTLQIQGDAEIATGDIKPLRDLHVARVPASVKYADNPDQRWVLVTPTWYRYTNFSAKPESVVEKSL